MESDVSVGADSAVVSALLAAALHDPRWDPATVTLVSGGKSNLTYLVRSAAGEAVLRRPPLGQVLPTAHDMVREHRVLTALAPTPVPVPRTLHLGTAEDGLGTPFYVMERVVGHVARDGLPVGYAATPADRRRIADRLVDVLAELHTVDPAAVGLADFGRPEGFMARQLRRWAQQWEASKTAELPLLDRLHDELAASLPEPVAAVIVHGDYRLDNTVLHPARPGEVSAVLDWEMSTLGDPLADLGTTLMYWAQADDPAELRSIQLVSPVTALEGFPTRSDVVARYAERTGFPVEGVPWYLAFAFYKFAVVVQGIVARVAAGAMLGPGFDGLEGRVAPLAELGLATLARREMF